MASSIPLILSRDPELVEGSRVEGRSYRSSRREDAMDLTELATLRQSIGRTQTASDVLTPVPATLLAATIDRDDPPYKAGDELPPNWHRLYFLTAVRPAEVG